MKVFIVTKEGFPNGMAATNRIKCYARAIREGGIDCEIVVCGCTELKVDSIHNKHASGTYESIPFQYIGGTTTDTRPELIRRSAQFFRILLTERYLYHHLNKGDVVLLYMGRRVKESLRIMKLAKMKGAYCIYDLCEYPFATMKDVNRAKQMMKLMVDKLLSKVDGVVSISESLLDFAKHSTPSKCQHIKVPIMVEYEHYVIKEKQPPLKNPYIFHAGTLYQEKDGILGMIEAFGIARRSIKYPINYYLTGNIDESSHPEELKDLITKYNLNDSVHFIGYLNREQIKDYLCRASLVISNRPRSIQDFYGFSTKLGEYLASGTPLITTNWGEAVNWLKDGESAYIVEPENNIALANAIIRVFNNLNEAKVIGMNGQNICRLKFDYRNWSIPIINFINQLAI